MKSLESKAGVCFWGLGKPGPFLFGGFRLLLRNRKVRAKQEAEMRIDHQETPDIEVAADQWEEEQAVLRELAQEDDGLEDARGLSECMAECARMDS